MDRRGFLQMAAAGWAGALAPAGAPGPAGPNILLILADDLGRGELGCYGQKLIRTPHLDRLAREGWRFTQAYAGSPVCAPSRCALLTGLHTGHAFVRDNREVGAWESFQGQLPLPAGTATIARLLKERGYATACVGKWGLGRPGSTGEPSRQGFDLFFGYNCQRHAHDYYPRYLWRNGERVELPGDDRGPSGRHYAPDLMLAEALGFLREGRRRPFFLYYATPVPHLALQVPADSLREYEGAFPESAYDGKKGYLPHPAPRAAYAAMVTRLDRDVGRLLACLAELGLERETLVIFASDNGPTYTGGADSAFFGSAGPFRGLKGSLHEGGIRIPLLASWPGRLPAGAVSSLPVALWDLLPTLAELAGAPIPPGRDGTSLGSLLLGRRERSERGPLYWEFPGYGGQQALRWGRWKAIRTGLAQDPAAPLELYDLEADPGEARNLARENPALVVRMAELLRENHRESREFPLLLAPPGSRRV